MPKVTVLKTDGTQAGEIELSEEVFGAEVNQSLIHQAVVTQLANKRQGTQCALTRAEVRGGGIKPFRQKGTGRARQGSSRAPQYTHGGTVFAPKPRSYAKKMNKLAKQIAIVSALSMKLADSELIVIDKVDIEPKTKAAVKMLSAIKAEGKALIITAEKDDTLLRATGNLQGVQAAMAGSFSVYDIVNCDHLILTEDAVKAIEEVYA